MKNGLWYREPSDYFVLQLVQGSDRVHGLILEATDVVGQFKRWGLFKPSRESLAATFRESIQTARRQEDFPGQYCQGLGYTVTIV
jgi:hypothetical protein